MLAGRERRAPLGSVPERRMARGDPVSWLAILTAFGAGALVFLAFSVLLDWVEDRRRRGRRVAAALSPFAGRSVRIVGPLPRRPYDWAEEGDR